MGRCTSVSLLRWHEEWRPEQPEILIRNKGDSSPRGPHAALIAQGPDDHLLGISPAEAAAAGAEAGMAAGAGAAPGMTACAGAEGALAALGALAARSRRLSEDGARGPPPSAAIFSERFSFATASS